MKPTDRKRIVVVLGMHRSGTSAVTRSLMALGVQLGDRLMPGKPEDNEKGFWEDLDLNELNIEMLNALGHDWNTNAPIARAELLDDRVSPFRLRAVELLRRKTRSTPIWGIKDPRISRLLPFWKNIFEHLDIDVSYVIVVRHPMSVARSLKKRNGFEPEKSYYLWLDHIVPALLETEGSPRVVVDYDIFMDDPEAQLARIAERISLPAGQDRSRAIEECRRDFLDAGLRHTRFQQEDLLLDQAAPEQAVCAYALLRKLATDEAPLDSPEVRSAFEQLACYLDEMSPALRYMTLLENNISVLGRDVTERDQHIAALDKTLDDRNEHIVALDKSLDDRNEHIVALDQSLDDRNERIAALDESLNDRNEHIAALDKSLDDRNEHIAALDKSLSDRDERIVALDKSLNDRDEHIVVLDRSVRERDQHIHDLDQRIGHLDRVVAERDSQLAALAQAVAGHLAEISALRSSTSWRITAPLRSIGAGARSLKNSLSSWRNVVKQGGRLAYRRLPLTQAAKWRLRAFAFRHFGSIFGVKQATAPADRTNDESHSTAVTPGRDGGSPPAEAKGIQRILENLNQPAFPDSAHAWTCSRFMLHLWKSRPDLQQVFDLDSEEDRKNFAHWYLLSARHEYGLPASAYPNYMLENLAACDYGAVRKAAQEFLDANASGTAWPDLHADSGKAAAAELPGANLIGYARGEFGMGEHVRMVARACAEAGTPFTIIDFEEKGFHGNQDKSVDAWISDTQKYATNIFHINADVFPALFFHYGVRFFARHTNIGYWAWELAQCPEEFDLALSMVDEVWAISDFVRASFQQRSPVPVFNMPLAVSLPELQREYDKGFFDIPEDSFAFLFTFDAASYLDRKNPIGAVKAFKRAFPGRSEKVCLVLKTMNAQESDPLWKQLKDELDGDNRIHLITSRMTRDEILGLNSVCDAFVSLHRSEGFGRCLAESMWMGKPVIATNYSGSRDFAREGTACVVDYQLVPIQEGRYPCWRNQVWADPDIDHASWFMKKLVNDPVFRNYIAKAGQDFIRKNFNEKAIGEKYAERLREIAANKRSGTSTPPQEANAPQQPRYSSAGETLTGRIDLPHATTAEMPCLRGQAELAGWAVAGSGVVGVDVFMDGQLLGQAHYGLLRPDVGAAHPEIDGSPRSGFFRMLNTRAFPDGAHRLAVVVSSHSGLSITLDMRVRIDNSVTSYDTWLENNLLTENQAEIIRSAVRCMPVRPLLSLVATAPTGSDSNLVMDTLNSLEEQIYPDWELVIDATEVQGRALLETARRLGIANRLVVRNCATGGLEQRLGCAKGSHAGMLDWGDRLDSRALYAIANTLNADPSLDIVYTDEDRMVAGRRSAPLFKPAWSPSLLDGTNYLGRLWFVRKSLLPPSMSSRTDNESAEHALLKNIAAGTRHVAHIPMVLYSRRDDGRQDGWSTGSPGAPHSTPVLNAVATDAASPLVSVIMPTCLGDPQIVEKCLVSLFEMTAYDNLEVILVVNNIADAEAARSFLSRWPAKVLHWEGAFNWSAVNNFGAAHANGELLLFMNDDIEVMGRDWLDAMVSAAAYPGIGVVGATLRYPNRTLQHAGTFLVPLGSGTRHAFRFCTGEEPELKSLLSFDRECTAVTGACMLTKAAVFRSLGGFDETLSLVCNDTDYCLRLRASDYRCIVAAKTDLVHHEGISRAGISETGDVLRFRERWGHLLAHGDPYLNPNVAMVRDDWAVDPDAVGSLVGRRSLV